MLDAGIKLLYFSICSNKTFSSRITCTQELENFELDTINWQLLIDQPMQVGAYQSMKRVVQRFQSVLRKEFSIHNFKCDKTNFDWYSIVRSITAKHGFQPELLVWVTAMHIKNDWQTNEQKLRCILWNFIAIITCMPELDNFE